MKTILGVTLVLLSLGAIAQSRLDRPTGETFEQLAELTGSGPYALVSGSVAISGSSLVIGVPGATYGSCYECGVAYVYTAVDGDWSDLALTATLMQSSGQGEFAFGEAVAINGDAIAVGGYDFSAQTGAAYLYISPSGTVTENAELTTSGAPSNFFYSIAIDGNIIVAGSPLASVGSETELGAAYVYVRPTAGWVNMTQTALLAANNESSGCYFGNSVGVSGNTVVVGAQRSEGNGLVHRGRAYVFVQPTEGWSGTRGQTAELDPSDGTSEAQFGYAVSVSGGNVVVGAPEETVGSNGTEGALYVYTRPSTGWPKTMTETAELTASTGKAGSLLGFSVALSGTTLLAGAVGARSDQGVAYVFNEPSGGWQTASGGTAIAASDGVPSDDFGTAVGIGGGVLAVSEPGWPNGGIGEDGAVYIFGPAQ